MNVRELFRLKRWTLCVWDRIAHWTWLPKRTKYWRGEFHHFQWGPFELIHDCRKDWIGDVLGVNRRETP